MHGASESTLHRAMHDHLIPEGLIVTLRGYGCYVNKPGWKPVRLPRTTPVILGGPYREVADKIRERIKRGVYPPGRRLPSLVQFAHIYSTTPAIARHALQVLCDEGLAISRGGTSGYYVTPWATADADEAEKLRTTALLAILVSGLGNSEIAERIGSSRHIVARRIAEPELLTPEWSKRIINALRTDAAE